MDFNPNDLQAWPKERLAQFLKHLPQIADAMAERVRQDAKHGVQIRPAYEYAMILQEEVGEYQKEVTEGYYDKVEFRPNLRAELVQVAAVALAALFSYDTRAERVAQGFTADMATPAERHAHRMALADALHTEPAPAPNCPNNLPGCFCDSEACAVRRFAPDPTTGPNNPHAKQPE